MRDTHLIPPRSGAAFTIARGQRLRVIDPEGQQVSDMVSFNRADPREHLSSGRSIDYAGRQFLGRGDTLYSNRSEPMWEITEDTCGRHDFTLTPCSERMFRTLYGEQHAHPGCFGNLASALEPFLAPSGLGPDAVPIAFNIFMYVHVDSATGEVEVRPPLSGPGDHILLEARQDMVVGLTACSAGQSNNFRYKPIHWRVEGH